jgi:purine-binding chemotaxis protein CheW
MAMASIGASARPESTGSEELEFVSVFVGDQLFGLPIQRVRDVFMVQTMTPVPLASPEIAGLINLRGRVATAIDLRRRLGLPDMESGPLMAVGIEARGDSYGLLVQGVGEVVRLGRNTREDNPIHMSPAWAALSSGVHRLDDRLLIILDVDALLDLDANASV